MLVGNMLFGKDDLDAHLAMRRRSIADVVRKKMTEDVLSRSDQDLVESLVPSLQVSPLEVDFDNPAKSVNEVPVVVADVFGDRARIQGVRASRAYPFRGERELFEYRTNPYTLSRPHGRVDRLTIVIAYEGRNDLEQIKTALDREERVLREYVGYSTEQVKAFNAHLRQAIGEEVAARRKALTDLQTLRNGI